MMFYDLNAYEQHLWPPVIDAPPLYMSDESEPMIQSFNQSQSASISYLPPTEPPQEPAGAPFYNIVQSTPLAPQAQPRGFSLLEELYSDDLAFDAFLSLFPQPNAEFPQSGSSYPSQAPFPIPESLDSLAPSSSDWSGLPSVMDGMPQVEVDVSMDAGSDLLVQSSAPSNLTPTWLPADDTSQTLSPLTPLSPLMPPVPVSKISPSPTRRSARIRAIHEGKERVSDETDNEGHSEPSSEVSADCAPTGVQSAAHFTFESDEEEEHLPLKAAPKGVKSGAVGPPGKSGPKPSTCPIPGCGKNFGDENEMLRHAYTVLKHAKFRMTSAWEAIKETLPARVFKMSYCDQCSVASQEAPMRSDSLSRHFRKMHTSGMHFPSVGRTGLRSGVKRPIRQVRRAPIRQVKKAQKKKAAGGGRKLRGRK